MLRPMSSISELNQEVQSKLDPPGPGPPWTWSWNPAGPGTWTLLDLEADLDPPGPDPPFIHSSVCGGGDAFRVISSCRNLQLLSSCVSVCSGLQLCPDSGFWILSE